MRFRSRFAELRFQGEDLDRPAGRKTSPPDYKFVEGPNGPEQATRNGELEIAPPGLAQDGAAGTISCRTAEGDKLRGRFNDLLPPDDRIPRTGFLPIGPAMEQNRRLQTYRVSSGDGWLSIDWKQQ